MLPMLCLCASSLLSSAFATHTYTTHTIIQPCDHSDYSSDAPTFAQRYLVADLSSSAPPASTTASSASASAPVLFYAGNEGPIESFAAATGWQWELGAQIGAVVVFAEHRGYGASATPSSSASSSSASTSPPLAAPPCGPGFRHVSSAQALRDFAALGAHLRTPAGDAAAPRVDANSTIVAVGGSYGGMLAAWLRLRFGHIFDGALAASAPVALGAQWDPTSLYARVGADFAPCAGGVGGVGAAFRAVWAAGSASAAGRATLAAGLGLCQPPRNVKRVEVLVGVLQQAFMTMAELDYPYAVNFTGYALPAHPAAESCRRFSAAVGAEASAVAGASAVVGASTTGVGAAGVGAVGASTPGAGASARASALIAAMGRAVSVVPQLDPARSPGGCVNLSDVASFEETLPGLTVGAWSYQRCSDIVIPYEASVETCSLFLPCRSPSVNFTANCWNETRFGEWCDRTFWGERRGRRGGGKRSVCVCVCSNQVTHVVHRFLSVTNSKHFTRHSSP